MSNSESSLLEAVDRIAREVVAAHAADVDRKAAFPAEAVAALGEAGVLGLTTSRDLGGLGHGPRVAALVVERIARECGSTAMVVTMHFAGVAVLERFAPESVRRDVAAGRHLSTLAFSEAGSRSMFWAPVSSAERMDGGAVRLTARKSWITSASHATAYVWSSRPLSAEGVSTIWLVPRTAGGLRIGAPFDGLGLRGNDSVPVTAEGVTVPGSAMLGQDGQGLSVMLEVALPTFNILTAACSVGMMEAAVERAAAHASTTRFENGGSSLADLPTLRAYIARMRVATDQARCLLLDTAAAVEGGRADAMLRVLESKAAAGESAAEVLDTAMRVCGGAAFRKEVGVERIFRDSRAANVMAPTTDQLYDFIGKAVCGLPVF
ncbi:MAG TPA: acyl-CoA dehydrogenase family protein [Kofleriaceae bacterium]|nr:acyl-CoA dehydrogenase family protein [Kofleriaceae bacterium]